MRYYPVFDNLFDDFFTTNSRGTSLVMKTDIVEKMEIMNYPLKC